MIVFGMENLKTRNNRLADAVICIPIPENISEIKLKLSKWRHLGNTTNIGLLSGFHSHCLFVLHHWHWLSSVRVWRLL